MTGEDGVPRQLTKGANIGLEDVGAELGGLTVILETGDADGTPVDADVSVLLLGVEGRVRSNDDLVFYNQPVALSGAVHLRDKIRSGTPDGGTVSADLLTIDLDAVPDDVDRIVLSASLDPSQSLTFGQAEFARLRLQRTSDGAGLVEYRIDDASGELALLFGEFYRRNGRWRLRAIGQGYDAGLAALVQDFGIDVESGDGEAGQAGAEGAEGADAADTGTDADETSADVVSSEPGDGGETAGTAPMIDAAPSPADDDPSETSDAAAIGSLDTPAPIATTGRVSVRRAIRAPRLPADWNSTVPARDDGDFIPARLFPVAGIGSASEAEGRASSALLAVMALVRDFGRALTAPLGAPAGTIRTFTEVPFGHEDQPYRPDGLITVTRGNRVWNALVEVKTSDVPLATKQIEIYVEIAREKGFDAVLTISNQIMGAADDHPVSIDRRKLRKVSLHHLSWDDIRTRAILLTRHSRIADPTQRIVLAEFLRYMHFERSGMNGFRSMGKEWVPVRDGVKARTRRARDAGTVRVSASFDQLISHVALHLTALLGVEVQPAVPRRAADATSRCQQLADSGAMFGVLRVPGAVGAMIVSADVRADRVTCAVDIDAPREGRPLTRVNWLLRQLGEARPTTRVEAGSGGRSTSTARLLRDLREKPQALLPEDGRDIKSFRVALDVPMGLKHGVGKGSLIGSVLDVTTAFYAEVVQNLRPWNARPPQLPPSS